MVIFFDGPVIYGLFVPPIKPKLPDAIRTAGIEKHIPALEPCGHVPDARHDRIGGLFNEKAPVPPDALNERGGGRVHNYALDREISSQLFQLRVVFLVGLLASPFPAVIVVLPHPVPLAVRTAPEAMLVGLAVP